MEANFDLRSSDTFVAAHPGLRVAFDPVSMAASLSDALGSSVVACEPGLALFEPDGYCMVRYSIELESGVKLMASARLFRTANAAEAFRRRVLAPLVADLDCRSHRPPVPTLASTVPALAMAVSVFPVDAELPALPRVTDPDELATLLEGASLPAPHRLAVENYARRRRCTIRCEAGDPSSPRVAYLKVANDGGGRITASATAALRQIGADFDVPPVLVDRPDLGLAVLGGIPGSPRVAKLLKARIHGSEPPADAPPLGQAIEACGRIAATFHRAELPGAPRRTLGTEVASLRALLDVVRRYTPELATRLEPAVISLESSATESIADAEVTAHGDFSYSQLLFSGDRHGIVDFDGVCRAEPALDLGHFLAYLRFAVVKAAGVDHAARFAPLGAELETLFLDAYRSASGDTAAVADERIRLYENASLVRLALHAWQKMKPQRLGWLLTALDGQRTTAP